MCGIFGIATNGDRPLDGCRAHDALHTLFHRGPEDVGHYSKNNVFMGHQRLSILDLSSKGHQPMSSGNGMVHLTVNGEIYNFQALRHTLERAYTFHSHTDSEVILNGYLQWGLEGLLEKIDGMFAFAILDEEKGKIHLVRDRVGIKPLYYGYRSGVLLWASELKAIEHYWKENLEYDPEAVYDFLTYGYVPTPKSLYKNVFKLPPAHHLTLDLDRSCLTGPIRYWSPSTNVIPRTDGQAEEELRSCLHQSVKEQLVSDVPLGCFLSGGIDSSCVVVEAVSLNPHIGTYTIGFDAPGDEAPYASYLAEKFRTDHHVQYFNEKDLDLHHHMKAWFDEPFADMSALPTYLVAKYTRTNCTVALSGDGGDELFGGYRRYAIFEEYLKANGEKPGFLARMLINKMSGTCMAPAVRIRNKIGYMGGFEPFELYAKLHSGMIRSEKKRIANSLEIPADYDDYWYFRKFYRTDLSVRRRLQWMDFHTYLHDDILTKVDRTTMQVSLEARVPFLSRKMIEFAFSLDESLIYPKGKLKGLLKNAYAKALGKRIINKPKQGFSIQSPSRFSTPGDLHKSILALFVQLKGVDIG